MPWQSVLEDNDKITKEYSCCHILFQGCQVFITAVKHATFFKGFEICLVWDCLSSTPVSHSSTTK